MMKQRLVLVLASLMVATPLWAQRKVDEVRPLAADGVVEISNIAGSVQVLGWGSNQVEITGTLGPDVEELEISGSDRRLEIEVEVPREARHVESDLVIRIPATAAVEVETVSASIEVDGIDGKVDLESVSGVVRIKGRPAELSVETVSGEIAVASSARRTELASVSGGITVEEATGRLDAASVSGKIKILGGFLDGASFETVSGGIVFDADMAPSGEFEFESLSGTVALTVSPGVGADFEVTTFSGSIVNEIGPDAESTSKYTPEKELRFSAAGGGAQVSIESFSGTVKIQAR
jgi:DUF4097 and DUF4098 domain-containing protein YvlB